MVMLMMTLVKSTHCLFVHYLMALRQLQRLHWLWWKGVVSKKGFMFCIRILFWHMKGGDWQKSWKISVKVGVMWLKFELSISRIQIISVYVRAEPNCLVWHGIVLDGKSFWLPVICWAKDSVLRKGFISNLILEVETNNIPTEYILTSWIFGTLWFDWYELSYVCTPSTDYFFLIWVWHILKYIHCVVLNGRMD
jgi:hypothetical protein